MSCRWVLVWFQLAPMVTVPRRAGFGSTTQVEGAKNRDCAEQVNPNDAVGDKNASWKLQEPVTKKIQ